jgi:hypothetical protein
MLDFLTHWESGCKTSRAYESFLTYGEIGYKELRTYASP